MPKLKEVFCKKCGKSFFRSNGRYNEAKRFSWNQYCSRECLSKDRTKQKLITCENCNKSFWRAPNDILKHNFCSQSCAAIINNKRYPKTRLIFNSKTCIQCGDQFRASKGNKKYCSMKCRKEKEFYTPEEILKIIRDYFLKHGRIPARREMRGISSACQRAFSSWNNAIIAAGLSPNRSDSQRMYKRTNTKALDGHLCDSVSEALIDNWLFSHKILHQRDARYPTTNHKADWAVDIGGKRIFIEYFGLAKDSKRYDRDIEHKKELCRANKIPLIEIYPQDLYPRLRLKEKLSGLKG